MFYTDKISSLIFNDDDDKNNNEEEEDEEKEEEENTGISCLMSVIPSWKSNSLLENINWKLFPLF